MDTSVSLESLGYGEFFENSRLQLEAATEQMFRVTAEHKGIYEVIGQAGDFHAIVTGKRMLDATSRDDFPAVGDWVIAKNSDGDKKVISDILPRKTTLHKKYGGKDESQLMAANIDVALIVESIDRDYNLNRFERYLVLASEGGVKPVIILNKSDLSSDADTAAMVREIHDRFGSVEVIATSTVTESGMQELTDLIEAGKTYCFMGSSGVGKSSIINELLQHNLVATSAIGGKSGRGRHTTTSRQMYFTDFGGIIIDNPGSREVGVADSTSGVEEVFSGIELLASTCKFADCRHDAEPGCVLQDALKSGSIDRSRFENYLRMQKETQHYQLSDYEKRQKNKKFGKFIKTAKTDIKKFKSR